MKNFIDKNATLIIILLVIYVMYLRQLNQRAADETPLRPRANNKEPFAYTNNY